MLLIANIGPAENNYDETANTLRFANRAKNIKNKAKVNQDPKDSQLKKYQQVREHLLKRPLQFHEKIRFLMI